MSLERESLDLLPGALDKLVDAFKGLPEFTPGLDREGVRKVLAEVAARMGDNYPYHHPLYAGQMLKPPHPVARMAYALSMWINPNNHALDGGRASSALEKEAVAQIAAIFGWTEHLGHLCGGGTMANLEALWVAGRLKPGTTIVASSQAHYTHARISEVLHLDFISVPVDAQGRMDLGALNKILDEQEVGTVVATLGSTGLGAVDPLPEIIELQKGYGFRVHADSAYGGYFTLVDNLRPKTKQAFEALQWVDSIVVDPHKHGLQPYGCGCVLFQDPGVGAIYRHDSPYTYFSSDELHLGEISLECSRAGASAVALWATQKLLPLERAGTFARGLARGREAALTLFEWLGADDRFVTALNPELDILIFALAGKSASQISQASRGFFERAAEKDLHLALVELPKDLMTPYWPEVVFDQATVTCLRSCLMKPEHLEWLEKIWEILDRVGNQRTDQNTGKSS